MIYAVSASFTCLKSDAELIAEFVHEWMEHLRLHQLEEAWPGIPIVDPPEERDDGSVVQILTWTVVDAPNAWDAIVEVRGYLNMSSRPELFLAFPEVSVHVTPRED